MKEAQKHCLFAVIPAQAGIQKSLIYMKTMKTMKDMKKGVF